MKNFFVGVTDEPVGMTLVIVMIMFLMIAISGFVFDAKRPSPASTTPATQSR